MKTLYYYALPEEAKKAVGAGVLLPFRSDAQGPLSSTADLPSALWLTTRSTSDRVLVRFTLRLPNDRVVPWLDWVKRHGPQDADRQVIWLRDLIRVTGGMTAARARRVCEFRITDHRWTSVVDLFTGEKLWEPKGRRNA